MRDVAILGAGLMGSSAALALADAGCRVTLFERNPAPLQEASRHGEGKLHLGFVYAADPSFRTAALMQRGAAAFLPILSRWLPAARLDSLLCRPFDYVVHRDSMLPVEAIEAHFARVAAEWRGDPAWAAHRRRPPGALADRYDPGLVQAAFETGEVAIDTPAVADHLAAALAAHPAIERRYDHAVLAAEPRAGGWAVRCRAAGAERAEGPFAAVVNCLWSNRAAVDVASGQAPPAPFLVRFKLAAKWCAPGGLPADLPSATIVLGRFGDIVAWPSGRLYLSWYPTAMVGAWRDVGAPDWRAPLGALDRPALAASMVAALSRICPALARAVAAAGEPEVEGGTIFALGATDIDDPASRLHERHEVGLVASRDGYHSVDTGKYTLAPLLARELAARIAPRGG